MPEEKKKTQKQIKKEIRKDLKDNDKKRGKKRPMFLMFSVKEKIFFSKHLAIMIKAGIPLCDALEALHDQAQTKSLRHVLNECINDVRGGQVLAYSLEKFPRVFDPFFSNVVRVGETSGTLAESLAYLAAQIEKAKEIRSKVRSAMIYPAIVFFGALGIGGYLAFFLLPQLLPLFTSLGSDLPATTRALLAITNFLSNYWIWVIIGFIIFIIVIILLWRIKKVKFLVHSLLLISPIAGNLIRQIQGTQFSLILGTLLTSGVKIVPALRITGESLKNLVFTESLLEVADLVERGETIGAQFKKHPKLFSRTTTSMVEVGERTGKLAESLIALAQFSEKEVDNAMKNLSSLIEPIVLIVVGLLVGFVAFSVISPIYQLTQSVGL